MTVFLHEDKRTTHPLHRNVDYIYTTSTRCINTVNVFHDIYIILCMNLLLYQNFKLMETRLTREEAALLMSRQTLRTEGLNELIRVHELLYKPLPQILLLAAFVMDRMLLAVLRLTASGRKDNMQMNLRYCMRMTSLAALRVSFACVPKFLCAELIYDFLDEHEV
jgi:hypothetical protein